MNLEEKREELKKSIMMREANKNDVDLICKIEISANGLHDVKNIFN